MPNLVQIHSDTYMGVSWGQAHVQLNYDSVFFIGLCIFSSPSIYVSAMAQNAWNNVESSPWGLKN